MTFLSFRSTQVNTKSHPQCPSLYYPFYLLLFTFAIVLKSENAKHTIITQGEIQQYEIIRTAKRPPKITNTNSTLLMWNIMVLQSQTPDQDIEDLSSPINNKRAQLILYQPMQHKKTKNTSQAEHSQHTHQDLWLDYQAMESIARNSETPPLIPSTPICDLLKRGYNKITKNGHRVGRPQGTYSNSMHRQK